MGQKPSLDETRLKAREWQSELKSEVRRMDREIKRIQTEEGKLQQETKTQAAKGNVGSAQMLAKQIVKSRAACRRLERTKVSMHAVHLQLATSVATMSTTGALKISADAMRKMNLIAGQNGVSSALSEMQRQMATTATIEEQMDEALMEPGEEEETSAEVQKILDEMSLGHLAILAESTGPTSALPLASAAAVAQPYQAPRSAVAELSIGPPTKRPRVEPAAPAPAAAAAPPMAAAPPAAAAQPTVALPLAAAAPQPAAAAAMRAVLSSKHDEIAQLRARLEVAEGAVGAAAATSAYAAAAAEKATVAVRAASAVVDSLAAPASLEVSTAGR